MGTKVICECDLCGKIEEGIWSSAPPKLNFIHIKDEEWNRAELYKKHRK